MKAIVFLLSLTVLVSCASKQVEQEVRAEAAKENSVDKKALGNTIHDLIQSSKTLTADQKTELTNILKVNKETAEKLSEDSYKFRAVLIKELLSGKANPKKISVIKKDIKKIEAARLKNTFDTVEKISKIVSKHPNHGNEFAEHLLIMERPNSANK